MDTDRAASGPERPASSLTSGTHLARNSIFNLLGLGVPVAAALVAIPLLIQGLGTDRFGILTLAWLVIGYFSLFDLGLGRALTQIVAAKLSEGQAKAPPLVWTAVALSAGLGLLGAAVLMLVSPWLVHSVLRISAGIQVETVHALYVLSATIPFVVVTAALIGLLSGYHRFGILSMIRAPLGIYTYAAPLAVLPFSRSLVPVMGILCLGRALACGAHFLACSDILPPLRSGATGPDTSLKPLFRFGAWMTVTNVVGPMMVYLDRVVIGSLVSMAAVAYYATPYEMVTKLLIAPNAMLGTLFPAFASTFEQDRKRMVILFVRGTKYAGIVLFPAILLIEAFAEEGLRWWLGGEFAVQGATVLRCLAAGVFINGLAQVFVTLIQGVGRPELTARLHLLELPLYLPLLWWAVRAHGVVGAAAAWTARVSLDCLLHFWVAHRILEDKSVLRRIAAGLVVALGALMAPLGVAAGFPRAAVALLVLIAFLMGTWRILLGEEERTFIKVRLACPSRQ
jgi:O-antigen/teichoic acid export membrane protein